MRFAFIKLAVLASFIRHGRAADDSCLVGPFAYAQYAYSGLPFPAKWNHETMRCDTKWSSQDTIIGIEAWATYDHIEGVKFKYALSGWGALHGNAPKTGTKNLATNKAEWKAGEHVCKYFLELGNVKYCLTLDTAVQLWNNRPKGYPMDAVGKIVVSYANGGKQLFSVGCNQERMEPKQVDGIIQDSGIILGAKTQSGVDKRNKNDANWINTLEFLMLKENMVSTELTRVKLEENIDTWNTQAKGTYIISTLETVPAILTCNDVRRHRARPNVLYAILPQRRPKRHHRKRRNLQIWRHHNQRLYPNPPLRLDKRLWLHRRNRHRAIHQNTRMAQLHRRRSRSKSHGKIRRKIRPRVLAFRRQRV
jgi:hypothetical protein